MEGDQPLREAALYGVWGSATNITDGRYTYFRYPDDVVAQEIYQYTLMPTHLAAFFGTEELATATLAPPFKFSKNVPLLKVRGTEKSPVYKNYGPGALLETDTVLFDLLGDPGQTTPLRDMAVEERLSRLMHQLMQRNDAPPEAYVRLSLEVPG
jgi:hypothetical protein